VTVTNTAPPANYDGTVSAFMLRRGTCLWRVHRTEYAPWSFKTASANTLFGGARFDATGEDEYPYYYAGLDDETALCETLLRDVHPDDHSSRLVPHVAVAQRCISGLAVTADLPLISLRTGADLGAIGQDAWLVTAAGSEYAQTRGWAHWLRREAGWAFGMAWPSLRNISGTAIILFGDRCAAEFGDDYAQTLLHHIPRLTVHLGGKAGGDWLTERLSKFRAGVAPVE
jgi:RES domain